MLRDGRKPIAVPVQWFSWKLHNDSSVCGATLWMMSALVIGGLVDIIVTYLIILHCCHFLLYCFWVLWCACLGIEGCVHIIDWFIPVCLCLTRRCSQLCEERLQKVSNYQETRMPSKAVCEGNSLLPTVSGMINILPLLSRHSVFSAKSMP